MLSMVTLVNITTSCGKVTTHELVVLVLLPVVTVIIYIPLDSAMNIVLTTMAFVKLTTTNPGGKRSPSMLLNIGLTVGVV